MPNDHNNKPFPPLAGVVIFYNPTERDIQNILTYIDFLQILYIVDNSATSNSVLLNALAADSDKIQYIPKFDNLGVATALNTGCELAIKQGYEWILTMDQDSRFDVANLREFISSFEQKKLADPSIAIFTPARDEHQPTGYVSRAITSGNLLSLIAYKRVGGFDDALFIDEVDHDLCYKLVRSKYRIYTFDHVHMQHKIGNSKVHPFLFRSFFVMHHSAIRKYYIVRNRFLIRDRYPEFTNDYAKFNIELLMGVILFEDNKWLKLRHIIKGYYDYRRSNVGRMK